MRRQKKSLHMLHWTNTISEGECSQIRRERWSSLLERVVNSSIIIKLHLVMARHLTLLLQTPPKRGQMGGRGHCNVSFKGHYKEINTPLRWNICAQRSLDNIGKWAGQKTFLILSPVCRTCDCFLFCQTNPVVKLLRMACGRVVVSCLGYFTAQYAHICSGKYQIDMKMKR